MNIATAFVLGAGLGTRLRPLTDDLPKPLIPIFQKPLITFALDHLIALGVGRFLVNTHHLPERFAEAFPNSAYRDRSIEFVHEPRLLETGGGIKNIEGQLGSDPFITYSGDILTDFNLSPLLDEHFRNGNQVTLALRKTGLGSAITFQDRRIVRIAEKEGEAGEYDFANVAVWNADIFKRLAPGGKVSFIPVLAEWIRSGGKIGGVVMQDGSWFNIGSRTEYLEVHRTISKGRWSPAYVQENDWPRAVASSAFVGSTAQILGCSAVGEKCRIEAGAVLDDTIVWPGAQIASRSRLSGCIVRTRRQVDGQLSNVDI